MFFYVGHIFFVSMQLLSCKGWSCRYPPKWGDPRGAVCAGGVREGTMLLAQLSAGFQSLTLLPTSKLGRSVTDSWVGGFVYILGPYGSLQ